MNAGGPFVAAVARLTAHGFSKERQHCIGLRAGLGVEGDGHCGAAVQHLFDRARDPTRANLRQVHLIEAELLDELGRQGFAVAPGQLGENITTRHLDLVQLKAGTLLHLGATAVVRLTGLREPCVKIGRFQEGLRKAVTVRRDGCTFMLGAVMAVVTASGKVSEGDRILVEASKEATLLRPV
jgi:hypothetical protein